MSKKTKIVVLSLILVVLLAVVPLFVLKGAAFGGSDDAGSQMVEQIRGEAYEPWFTPVLEQAIGGELPGEIESLLFCVQTGLGVGVIAYGFGFFVARKRYSKEE
ncbi:energy-coupling factor ABC transporter substrate-binding protein [Clostridium sp. D33t1_170424_F3]|uniref:energy-coupling factor ABC transporter substrate-binding protein n=1 Tax=Clostridium sp. D33t1_170424_F3 TaxID=2787099 RepID=UPI0018AB5842|nr:energy-coupling factor ABC transporter substrate-binding protein [Clostridium sp. D33t1_170424_F3]